jgi:hypothetical protein
MMRNEYDPYSAVTFLLLGLGIGAVVAIVCKPTMRQTVRAEGINSWHRGVRPQKEGEKPNPPVA